MVTPVTIPPAMVAVPVAVVPLVGVTDSQFVVLELDTETLTAPPVLVTLTVWPAGVPIRLFCASADSGSLV